MQITNILNIPVALETSDELDALYRANCIVAEGDETAVEVFYSLVDALSSDHKYLAFFDESRKPVLRLKNIADLHDDEGENEAMRARFAHQYKVVGNEKWTSLF